MVKQSTKLDVENDGPLCCCDIYLKNAQDCSMKLKEKNLYSSSSHVPITADNLSRARGISQDGRVGIVSVLGVVGQKHTRGYFNGRYIMYTLSEDRPQLFVEAQHAPPNETRTSKRGNGFLTD